ncbi:hypothetical protein GCM10010503_19840 [Streptomyces lucensis JCM 4490]|uniref:Uncharacterized protein n=1 Tax=Streptomyces lucensis JCM 4490 TaxID=1306176 RepID=A0A918MND8_9ACTN|nr:hypothetical protein GCM10010503_19840 [Streptomyces lucensis JCM 4490]
MRPAAISARRKSPIPAIRPATGSRAFAQPGSTISCKGRGATGVTLLPDAGRRSTNAEARPGGPRRLIARWAPVSAPAVRRSPRGRAHLASPPPRQETTAARTHSTSGRCAASCRQLSPSSAEANTSPLRLPK